MAAGSVNLVQYLGHHISDICGNHYHDDGDDHCAHFVSHVLRFRFGFKCFNVTGSGPESDGASIRVHEIFSFCPKVGNWQDKPGSLSFCLAFVTAAANVNLQTGIMINHPMKHIGIYQNGLIYHYSNIANQVLEQTPEAFANYYAGRDIALFYGTMPS
ncbi:hypothetical protein [Thiosocius teredinicola]|uniref:hypothetical protein n=1 Tax=Thiosocius teredinicola TaxID=1973002 RepID=UPI000990B9F0